MEPFKIFVSHRHEDAAIAAKLVDSLCTFGGGNLEIFRSENVEPGEKWRKKIKEKLGRAELLLLLLTAPSELSSDWDWMLYEVGLFTDLTDTQKRIVALSPSNIEIPPALEMLQHIKAVPDQVMQFLRDLFSGTSLTGRDEPINIWLARDPARLDKFAGEICALLAPQRIGAQMHANFLIFKFQEPLREAVIPGDTEVEGNTMSFKMFGLLERDQWCWGDILGSLVGEKTWVSELGKSIQAISNGRYAKPIKTTLSSSEGQSFLPVVYRDEMRSSGLWLFHVLFVPTDVVPIDPKLVFVITAFKSDMEPVYEAIEAAVSNYGLSAKRVKDIVGDYRITDKILKLISQAKYVVADLTHERPNVYFELGYARGLGKTVITTVRKGTTVHFDVKDWTYIEYDDSRTLERQLKERIKAEGEAKHES